jgi:sensor histidine kinase YesM
MNSIQKKILMLTSIVLVIMSAIWLALTFYNHKTQNQYNDILQRYLSMNESNRASQIVIADLNNFRLNPTEIEANKLNVSIEKMKRAKKEIHQLGNSENISILTNYINLMDSLIEITERIQMFHSVGDTESAASAFSEATRISNYISEMSLSMLDIELKTYEPFYRGIIERSGEVINLGLWQLILITFLLLIITYWFSLSITRPIQKLTQAANELSKGRFDMQIEVETKDEISFLAKTFDRMRININNLILEIKNKAQLEHELQQNKILLQESQFRSLQSQINPHFLFNTLNTLSKKAYLEGSEDTSDLLVSVAGLLRYNLKSLDRAVTLQEEVAVIQQYMDIQKARFTDRLKLEMEIDEACLHVKIPALTLQPIIENAVIHAIEPKEKGGTIWFRIKDKNDWITIELEDDGAGMSDRKIKQILTEEVVPNEGHSTGIGFSNVVKRLRLFYGNDNVIEIVSRLGYGTKVILNIQKNQGGEKHDQAPNSR